MATPQERVVARARSEVGYVPAHDKFNKYARALDQMGPYDYPKDGYDWCDVFYGWLLVEERTCDAYGSRLVATIQKAFGAYVDGLTGASARRTS